MFSWIYLNLIRSIYTRSNSANITSTLGLQAGYMLLPNDTDLERGQIGQEILTTCLQNGLLNNTPLQLITTEETNAKMNYWWASIHIRSLTLHFDEETNDKRLTYFFALLVNRRQKNNVQTIYRTRKTIKIEHTCKRKNKRGMTKQECLI